jgi:hypothetical protein
MIQYDKDGVTVFYIDAQGNRVAYGPFAGQAYSALLQIMSAQKQAIVDNAQAVANYNNVLGNVQISVNAGRGDTVTAPAKPLMIVVADADGTVTHVPFVPPLADLIVPAVTSAGGTVHGLVNTAVAAPPDTQAIMYNMILAMFRKEFPDA